MLIWREDKELSKYSKYKAKVDLIKIGQVASVLVLLTCSLGFCWGTALARVCSRVSVVGFCVRFRTAQVTSCHSRDSIPFLGPSPRG